MAVLSPRVIAMNLAALAALAGALGLNYVQKVRLERELAQAQATIATQQAAIDKQNARIGELQRAAAAASSSAASAARARLLAGERARAALGDGTHGPAALNAWLAETFP